MCAEYAETHGKCNNTDCGFQNVGECNDAETMREFIAFIGRLLSSNIKSQTTIKNTLRSYVDVDQSGTVINTAGFDNKSKGRFTTCPSY